MPLLWEDGVSDFKRDQNLVRAHQELAQAQSLICSAMAKTAKDARAQGVRFEAAREAIETAEDDLVELLGGQRRPAPLPLFGEAS